MAERKVILLPNADIEAANGLSQDSKYGGGNGGGDDMQARVAKLESDVEYIKRDIAEIKSDIKSMDSRLAEIEKGINSAKTTIKASATVVSIVFAFCAYIFGNYVSKILDALNGLILK
ncbi:hemolysin XhlA [Enterobacter sp. BNK-29]|uniref:hemolysin XhlA n=1 Tax=Enterobacter TaxID=547 RepID=UPI0020181AC6|nr:hemolysin XhlA [Enterobacter asburiae]